MTRLVVIVDEINFGESEAMSPVQGEASTAKDAEMLGEDVMDTAEVRLRDDEETSGLKRQFVVMIPLILHSLKL